MTLYEKIIAVYPELTDADFHPETGIINLHNDGDGADYIKKWEYSKPVPESLQQYVR